MKEKKNMIFILFSRRIQITFVNSQVGERFVIKKEKFSKKIR